MSFLDSTTFRPGSLTDRSELFVGFARAAILWERAWTALWPASGIVGGYIAAALIGVLGLFSPALRLLLLFGVLAGTTLAVYRSFRDFKLPRWDEGARRVERDSALTHRPISEKDDRLLVGAGHAQAETLWRAHLKRRLSQFIRLRVALPTSGLPARDPHALRYFVLLAVIAGLVISGKDWAHRLSVAFVPVEGQAAASSQLDAWINPPAYTGVPPIYLQRTTDATVAVPAGSDLVLRVHAAETLPILSMYPRPDSALPQFQGESSEYGASAKLAADTDVSVRAQGALLGRWHIKVVPDNPPLIAFAEPPGATERGAVKFAFTAGDDYGVVSVRALIRPVSSRSHAVLAVDLPLSAPSAKTIKDTAYRDLTGEPFAGLQVDITLEAKDGAGQVGVSKPARFWLPARVFTNPLARALIEQRQNLAIGEPNARERTARTLDALTIAPEHFFANQRATYLGIRAAYWSLESASRAGDIAQVQAMLWQIAVALEDGGVLTAAEQLRQLQQLLSEALAQGAPQGVIQSLLDRYRQALARYLQSLAQNGSKSNGPLPPNAKVLHAEDLMALLRAIEQMAQTGARGQAAQALSLLQGLLENLHVGAGAEGQGGPQSNALSGAIHGLSNLLGRQRQLLDKSLRQSQGAGDPKDGGGKGLSKQQQSLHQDLNKVIQGLGAQGISKPDALGEAGRQMGDAESQLGANQFDNAGQAQKNALDALRQAAGQLARELLKRGGEGQEGDQGDEDPLGRAAGTKGGIGGADVKIPDQSDLARARSILEELRKRASEQGRPKDELDYIDRLLKEF